MNKTLLFTTMLLLILSPAVQSDRPGQRVLRVSDGRVITFSQMTDDLKKASIVYVGEVHDIPAHHVRQLEIISAIHEADKPMAIGLEMFRAENQKALDSWVKGKLPLDQFLPVYYRNWTMPWPLYRDIFLYAREHELPTMGLNIPDSISKKIAAKGFGALTPEEKKELPPGISCNVDPTYMEFIRRAYSGHSHRDKGFVNFCEAQMVWDKSMAWHVMQFLRQNPDKTLVVLAGIGHAWKRGISEQVELDPKKYTSRVVLPSVPDQVDRETVTTEDADYLLLE
jgi:uncharacterized iron-regulated protein